MKKHININVFTLIILLFVQTQTFAKITGLDSLIVCSKIDSSQFDTKNFKSNESYKLPWSQVPINNIEWKKRAWVTITFCENKGGFNDNLASVMNKGILNGELIGYNSKDDRFTTQLTDDEIKKNSLLDYKHVFKYKFRIEWIMLKQEQKLLTRISGIAPLILLKTDNDEAIETVAYWIYYPDSRNYLALQRIINKNKYNAKNWDELLFYMNNNN